MKLEAGQVAVVTGAAGGIGRAIAQALHDRGLHVVLADIDADALAATAEAIGHDTPAVPTDVADPEQLRRLAETTLRLFGRVDLVFNNAGMGVAARSGRWNPLTGNDSGRSTCRASSTGCMPSSRTWSPRGGATSSIPRRWRD